MFEVIISNVNTGRVERKSFNSRDAASRHADWWLAGIWSPGNYRVEIHHRDLPLRSVSNNVTGEAA